MAACASRFLTGEPDGLRQQVALKNGIDQTHTQGLGRIDLPTRKHHVGSGLDTDQPWQTLGAAAAGDQAQAGFRKAQFGAAGRQPVVATHGQLKPAAQRHTMDGGDDRFVASRDQGQYLARHRPFAGGRRIELPDVSAAAEDPIRAGDNNRRHLVGPDGVLNAPEQAGAHRIAQAVDRRVVDGDKRHAVHQF